MTTRAVALFFIAIPALLLGGEIAQNPDPRSMPSLRIAWSWDGSATEVVLHGKRVFALQDHGITALDAASGAVVWEKRVGQTDDIASAVPLPLSATLAVASGPKVYLLDQTSGNIVHTIPVAGEVRKFIGPPLVAWIEHETESELIEIDEASGKILFRKTLPKLREVTSDGGVIFGLSGWSTDPPVKIFGIRLADLSEIWQKEFENLSELTTVNGKPFIALYPELDEGSSDPTESWDSIFRSLDSSSGNLGNPLPKRDPAQVSSSDDTWEFQLVNTADESGATTIRRNDPKTGKTIWSKTFPGSLDGHLQEADRLYIHYSSGSGRGFFEVLDWDTGKSLQRAYGLRDVRVLIRSENNFLATSYGSGIVAFSATEFGPPESVTVLVPEEVRKILFSKELTQTQCWWQDMDAALQDLKNLGKDAIPLIAAEIPNLSPAGISVAARVLADAGYSRSASLLASRLPELKPCSEYGWAQHNPPIAVLQSLAKIGSKAEAGAISQLLFDDSQPGEIRREAFASLATLADDDMDEILKRALDLLTPKAQLWWRPPDPGKHLARLGTLVGDQEIAKAYDERDYEQAMWLQRAQSSVRLRHQGISLILFPYGGLGGEANLWLMQVGSSGPIGSARFTGVSVHGKMIVSEDVRFKAEMEGVNILIQAENGEKYRVDLAALDIDQDDDGLSDIVEKRLHTNETEQDTDRDGLSDSMDPAPNSREKASTEEQLITASIFRQYFMFQNEEETEIQLAIMISEFALEWIGRSGPTITLSKTEDQAFFKNAGYNGARHISISPGSHARAKAGHERKLKADERVYSLTIYRGGLDAIGYDIVVRELKGEWYIKQIEFMWVS